MSGECKIMVALRIRPKEGCDGIYVKTELGKNQVVVNVPSLDDFKKVSRDLKRGEQVIQRIVGNDKNREYHYTYDRVYSTNFTQEEVYEDVGSIILQNCMEGYNSCLFAYGQTGSGKTHTMMGPTGEHYQEDMRGIIPRLCCDLFKTINKSMENEENVEYQVEVSMIEIYNEKIKDLFTKSENLEVRERGKNDFYIPKLSHQVVQQYEEIQNWLEIGSSNRTIAKTLMNNTSSRAHTVFQIHLKKTEEVTESKAKVNIVTKSVVNLIDLAGSEQMNSAIMGNEQKLENFEKRKKELIEINKSLSSLGRCIKTLHEKFSKKGNNKKRKNIHIPYRDSTLTKLIANSLGGNSKTIMIATLSPDPYHFEQTISTCRFADRVKNIKNKPLVNMDPKEKLIRDLQIKIKELEDFIAEKGFEESEKSEKSEKSEESEEIEGEESEEEESDEKEKDKNRSLLMSTPEDENISKDENESIKLREEVDSNGDGSNSSLFSLSKKLQVSKKLLMEQIIELRNKEDQNQVDENQEILNRQIEQFGILQKRQIALEQENSKILEEKQKSDFAALELREALEMEKEKMSEIEKELENYSFDNLEVSRIRSEEIRLNQNTRKKLELLIKEMKILQNERSENIELVSTKDNKLNELNEKLSKMDEEEIRMKKNIMISTNFIAEQSVKLRDNAKNMECLKSEKDGLIQTCENLKKNITEIENQGENYQKVIDNITLKYENLEKTFSANKKRISNSHKKMEKMEKVLQKTVENLEKEKIEKKLIEKEKKSMDLRISNLIDEYNKVTEELKNYKLRMKKKEKEFKEGELLKKQKQISKLINQEQKNHQKIVKTQTSKSSKLMEKKKKELEGLRHRMVKMKNIVTTVKKRSKVQLIKLKSKNATLSVKNSFLEKKLHLSQKLICKQRKKIVVDKNSRFSLESRHKNEIEKLKFEFDNNLKNSLKKMKEKYQKQLQKKNNVFRKAKDLIVKQNEALRNKNLQIIQPKTPTTTPVKVTPIIETPKIVGRDFLNEAQKSKLKSRKVNFGPDVNISSTNNSAIRKNKKVRSKSMKTIRPVNKKEEMIGIINRHKRGKSIHITSPSKNSKNKIVDSNNNNNNNKENEENNYKNNNDKLTLQQRRTIKKLQKIPEKVGFFSKWKTALKSMFD